MKKMTLKEVKNSYKNVVSIGYCSAYNLLRHLERIGYNSGVYGWNCNIFQFDYNTAIVTGYRPSGNVHPDHEVLKKYEELAKKIEYTNYDEYIQKHDEILSDFIKKILSK